jgi:hypothetical protein
MIECVGNKFAIVPRGVNAKSRWQPTGSRYDDLGGYFLPGNNGIWVLNTLKAPSQLVGSQPACTPARLPGVNQWLQSTVQEDQVQLFAQQTQSRQGPAGRGVVGRP